MIGLMGELAAELVSLRVLSIVELEGDGTVGSMSKVDNCVCGWKIDASN